MLEALHDFGLLGLDGNHPELLVIGLGHAGAGDRVVVLGLDPVIDGIAFLPRWGLRGHVEHVFVMPAFLRSLDLHGNGLHVRRRLRVLRPRDHGRDDLVIDGQAGQAIIVAGVERDDRLGAQRDRLVIVGRLEHLHYGRRVGNELDRIDRLVGGTDAGLIDQMEREPGKVLGRDGNVGLEMRAGGIERRVDGLRYSLQNNFRALERIGRGGADLEMTAGQQR